MKLFASVFFLTAAFSSVIYSQYSRHGHSEPTMLESKKTELIDEFGRVGNCELTSRFDAFFMQLSEQPSAVGYVIFYQGTDALPANYGDSGMERTFISHMYFRNFDSSRVVLIKGGFRQEATTQLWIGPPDGEEPKPTDTVPAPVIPISETFRFDQRDLILDDSNFELPSVRAEREAEEERMRAEIEAESHTEEPEPSADVSDAVVEAGADESEEVDSENEYVDTRTPEEIEADRFAWVSTKFGKLLEKRHDSTGVLIFYGDDETLDITRLNDFIEQGKQRLAKEAGINPDRITIRFGGYRNYPVIDYWIVPPGGEDPVSTPGERPVEEQDEPTS